jgi:hypothetical protein
MPHWERRIALDRILQFWPCVADIVTKPVGRRHDDAISTVI